MDAINWIELAYLELDLLLRYGATQEIVNAARRECDRRAALVLGRDMARPWTDGGVADDLYYSGL